MSHQFGNLCFHIEKKCDMGEVDVWGGMFGEKNISRKSILGWEMLEEIVGEGERNVEISKINSYLLERNKQLMFVILRSSC